MNQINDYCSQIETSLEFIRVEIKNIYDLQRKIIREMENIDGA
jgi:hypothetical protein